MPGRLSITSFLRVNPVRSLADRVSTGGRAVEGGEPARRSKRDGSWLGASLAAVWVGLLLFVVAYVTANGEAVISRFDGLDLSAYSTTSP